MPIFEIQSYISPPGARNGDKKRPVTRSPVRIPSRGIPMHPVRRPALVHLAFENTSAAWGTHARAVAALADGSRPDTRYRA